MIRKTVTGLAIVAVLAAGPAQAAASKKETIGIGTGGVIGAVAAGPVGCTPICISFI